MDLATCERLDTEIRQLVRAKLISDGPETEERAQAIVSAWLSDLWDIVRELEVEAELENDGEE